MFPHNSLVSLALPLLFINSAYGLDLEITERDSIKSTAQSLVGGIVGLYNTYQEQDGGVPGLFPDPYYWWEAGTVFNSLIEYSHLTGDSQFDSLVTEGIVHQIGDYNAFMPPNQTKTLGNDDQSFWGLVAMTAAEVGRKDPANFTWLEAAKNVFDSQVVRWDNETCDGGLRWQIFSFNRGYEYKNSLSNGNFFLLAARLASFTGNKTYAEWAERSYQWSVDIGLVDEKNYSVYDGSMTETNCSSINKIQWSAAHGIYTEATAFMANFTGGESKWKNAVQGFANSSSVFVDADTRALVEIACESRENCDVDQRAFKGITARSYARAIQVAPYTRNLLRPTLEASAEAAAEKCTGEGTEIECSFSWLEEDGMSGLGETFNALEVVQGLLYSDENIVSTEARDKANSTSPSPSSPGSSNRPSGSSTGAVPAETTGAAGRNTVVMAGLGFAAMVAML